jgi:hypothetical protein
MIVISASNVASNQSEKRGGKVEVFLAVDEQAFSICNF